MVKSRYEYHFRFGFTRHGMPQEDSQVMRSDIRYNLDTLGPEIALRLAGYRETEGNGELVSIVEYECKPTRLL